MIAQRVPVIAFCKSAEQEVILSGALAAMVAHEMSNAHEPRFYLSDEVLGLPRRAALDGLPGPPGPKAEAQSDSDS
jgi:hypothetical protein